MSEQVGEAVIRFKSDESDLNYDAIGEGAEKGGKRSGGRFSGAFKKALVGVGVATAAAAGVAIGTSIVGGFKNAVQQQQAEKVLGGLYGNAEKAKATLKDLAAVARDSPLDYTSYSKAAGDLAYAGVEGKKAVGILENVGQVIAAAGGGTENLDGATGAILKMVNAGKVQLDTLQQLSDSGVPILSGLADQMGVTIDEVNSLASEGAIDIDNVLEVLEESQGETFKKMKKAGVAAGESFGNEWAKAKDNVFTAIGTTLLPLLDRVAPVIGRIGDSAPDIIDGIARAFGKTADVVRGAIDPIKDLFGVLTGGGGDLRSTVVPVFDAIRQTVIDLIPILTRLGGEAIAQVLPVFLKVRDTVLGLIPVLLDLTGKVASAVIPVFLTMAETFTGTILPALARLSGYVIDTIVPVLVQIAEVVVNDVVPVLAGLAEFFYGTLYPALIEIATAVAERLKPVMDTLVQVLSEQVLPTVTKMSDQIRNELVPALKPLVSRIITVVGFLLKLAATILAKVIPPILKLAGFIISNLVPVIVKIVTFVARFVGKLFDLGQAIGEGIGHLARFAAALREKVLGGVTAVVEAVTGLPGRILKLVPKMLNAGKRIIRAFVDGLKNAGSVVSDIAGNVWDTLKGLINSGIDKINSALSFKIDLPLGKSVGIDPPDIPHLARGASRFPGGMAMVGEEGPELTVIPAGSRVYTAAQTRGILANQADAGGGGGDGGGNVYIGQMMPHDYAQFERQITEQRRLAAVGGQRP